MLILRFPMSNVEYKKHSYFYYRELTDLLGEKHNIEPLILSGNKGVTERNDRESNTSW